MSRQFLPERPDLDQLRRQAKELLRVATAGDPSAIARVRDGSQRMTLAAAQLALAREYGYDSWPRLKAEVERKTALVNGDTDRLAELIASHPELAADGVSSCFTPDPADSPLSFLAVAGFHGLVNHQRAGELARVMVAAGADVDGGHDAETPLIAAASYYETDMVRALIEAGANLEATGTEAPGGTALTHAVWFGRPDIVDVLVRAGAVVHNLREAAGAGDIAGFLTPRATIADRETAMITAAGCARLSVVDELLATGVDVNAAPGWHFGAGVTALHRAAWLGHADSVRHLLLRGADPERRDDEHQGTPLDWCRRRNNEWFPGQRIGSAVEEVLTEQPPS